VADGHHRTAAAYNVGKMRRDKAIQDKRVVTGSEDFNFFMTILYPSKQLKIMDYNRVLKTLNGLTTNEFLHKLTINGYQIQEGLTLETAKPKSKHTHSLYIDQKWYSCKIDPSKIPNDPVKSLDVQLLNDLVLDPILGIKDVRTDKRIDFVGGIRGL
jgi:uncharacterized protein (DUF1015 family)